MSQNTDAFLEAEQAITDLLNNVDELKRSIAGYIDSDAAHKDAATQLHKTGEQLQDAITHIRSFGVEAGAVAAALKSIGTPEILARLDGLAGPIRSLSEGWERLLRSLAESVENNNNAFAQLVQQLESKIEPITQLQNKLGALVKREAEADAKRQAALSEEVKAVLATHRDEVHRELGLLRLLIVGGMVIGVISLIATFIRQ